MPVQLLHQKKYLIHFTVTPNMFQSNSKGVATCGIKKFMLPQRFKDLKVFQIGEGNVEHYFFRPDNPPNFSFGLSFL